MMRMLYESGCRVGEFVRIRLKHLDFCNHSVFFPAENTKTKQPRTSYVSSGLSNELKDFLKRQCRISKRDERLLYPSEFLFVSQAKEPMIKASVKIECARFSLITFKRLVCSRFTDTIKKDGLCISTQCIHFVSRTLCMPSI